MFRSIVVAAMALAVSAAAIPAQAECSRYDRSGCNRDWFGEAEYNLRSIPRNIIRRGQAARAENRAYYARLEQGQYYDARYSDMAVPYDVPMGYYNMGHRYPFDACQYGQHRGCVNYTPIRIIENGIKVWRIIETRKLRKETERANDRAEAEAERDIEERYRPHRDEQSPREVANKPEMVTIINMTSGNLRVNNGAPIKQNGHTTGNRKFYAESDLTNCELDTVAINDTTTGVICR